MDTLDEMDEFLETYNLQRLNHENIENCNSTLTSRDGIRNQMPPHK